MSDVVDALRNLASEQPEKMIQVIDDLRVQWSSMTDEQKTQAKAALLGLRERLMALPADQFKAVTDRIASIS